MLTISSGMSGSGINRNILECKEKLVLILFYPLVVLIETYWNVKSDVR